MADPLELVGGACSFVFGAGVAWATFRGQISAARAEAATANSLAQDALSRISEEKNRSSKQDGELKLYNERIAFLRRDVDEMRGAVFKSRIASERDMPAVRQVPRPDERRDDTDPPPMRGRLPSRRDT